MKKMMFFVLVLLITASPVNAIDEFQSPDTVPQYQEILRIQRGEVRITINSSEQISFSPDGTRVVAAGSPTTIQVWDVTTGDVIHILELENPEGASWSPDGTIIVGGSNDYDFRVWDARTGDILIDTGVVYGRYSSWSQDSTQFVTNIMVVFDAQTGEVIQQLGSNWGIPYEAHWSPDGTMIATTSGWEGWHLNIWSVEGERLDTYWAGSSASWSPDSTRIASIGQIRAIDTGLPVLIIARMDNAIAWHPDGDWIASTGDEGEIFLWDAETGELVTMWQYDDCEINGFDWSPGGERFAINCIYREPEYGNDLIIWERIR